MSTGLAVRRDVAEPIIDPQLPIIDARHHLWVLCEAAISRIEGNSMLRRTSAPVARSYARYLFDEFMADLNTGHNVIASVFVEAQPIYRATEMTSVREVEFANGVAAMAASGLLCDVKVCAGIVGGVDLRMGESVEDLLVAHLQASGGRYRGVRSLVCFDEDPDLLGGDGCGAPHALADANFRSGFKRLQPLGLSFDVFLLEPQLPDLIDLARAFPETQIILDHVGAPLGIGRYAGRREERFPIWRNNIRTLSGCPNVAVKLGGLGMAFGGFKSFGSACSTISSQLAKEWSPYIETCIEAFGVDRCMFEGNFPADGVTCSYPVLWNTFKRIAVNASPDEKSALFGGTARRIYRLEM